MNSAKLITAFTAAAVLSIGQAYAQSNPHLGWEQKTEYAERYQGNPHEGFDIDATRTVARYQGNPHEGEEFKVVRIARGHGNPHVGFEIVPLTLASSE